MVLFNFKWFVLSGPVKVYAIAKEIMEGSGEQLFDHIAKCLAEFVRDRKLEDETKTLPLGFTFRYLIYKYFYNKLIT